MPTDLEDDTRKIRNDSRARRVCVCVRERYGTLITHAHNIADQTNAEHKKRMMETCDKCQVT